ncbi:MAG TPA: Mut7-C RNAse domain-containing protein [bacterium]
MKFVVDRMLGKLARLLRLLGFDAEYVTEVDDSDIEKWSMSGAIFLTRGRKYEKESKNSVYIVKENYPVFQVREIISALVIDLDVKNFFSRCLECNKLLEQAAEDDVKSRVPEYVRKTMNEFSTCPSCRRIYWEGTHRTHMQEMIDVIRKEKPYSQVENNYKNP